MAVQRCFWQRNTYAKRFFSPLWLYLRLVSFFLHFNCASKPEREKTNTHQNETIMTRTGASIRRTNAQSGIQFKLNYVHRCDKDIERKSSRRIQPEDESINTMLHQFGRKIPCKLCKMQIRRNAWQFYYVLRARFVCTPLFLLLFFHSCVVFFWLLGIVCLCLRVGYLHWISWTEWMDRYWNTFKEWKIVGKPKIVLAWRWSMPRRRIP